MRFRELPIAEAFAVELERKEDGRGYFVRTFCRDEFSAAGLHAAVGQCSVSWNRLRGTLRGMHYQRKPKAETKIVRCVRGAVYDVIVDLRSGSPTYGRWHAETLTEDGSVSLYIPRGCAHGFLTLEDGSELFYQIDESYDPALAAGVRWNDPAFGIEWPETPVVISDRDASWADYAL